MLRWGWTDMAGRAKSWWEHQRSEHDRQFEEERERKSTGKKKFTKEKR